METLGEGGGETEGAGQEAGHSQVEDEEIAGVAVSSPSCGWNVNGGRSRSKVKNFVFFYFSI